MIKIKLSFFTCLLLLFFNQGLAQKAIKEISVTDYGLRPGDGTNALLIVKKIIDEYRNKAFVLKFPKGRYDFYIDPISKAMIGFTMVNLKNVTIDGGGSSFIFHSKMNPFYIESCENISLKDFNIDWDRPYISQGEIVKASNEFIDLKIDKKAYPFSIENEKIVFHGEDWLAGVELYNLYDQEKKEIVYGTNDNPMGPDFFKSKAREIEEGVVRFYARPTYQPLPGTYVAMLHTRYLSQGIQLFNSKNVDLKNINIYHSLSMGVVGFRTENIQLDSVNVTANEKKNRVFSAVADAFHFSTCKGYIKINNCTHTGQADDFVNIHGEYTAVKARFDDYTLITEKTAKLREVKALIEKDDEVWLFDQAAMQRTASYRVKNVSPIYKDNKINGYKISFSTKLPAQINSRFFIENKTWNPEVEIRNCKILKRHRARGILVIHLNKF